MELQGKKSKVKRDKKSWGCKWPWHGHWRAEAGLPMPSAVGLICCSLLPAPGFRWPAIFGFLLGLFVRSNSWVLKDVWLGLFSIGGRGKQDSPANGWLCTYPPGQFSVICLPAPSSKQACPCPLSFLKKEPPQSQYCESWRALAFCTKNKSKGVIPSWFSPAPLFSTDSRNQSRKESIIKKLFRYSEERYTALKKALLIISTVRAWTLLWEDPLKVGKVHTQCIQIVERWSGGYNLSRRIG